MELNIEWTKVEDVTLLPNEYYFVGSSMHTIPTHNVRCFSVAYRCPTEWRLLDGNAVHFNITHVCLISKISHAIFPVSYAIGDKVELIKTDCDYEQYSAGEIVGKYDQGQTWAVRMKDNFVILIKNENFRHHFAEGK